MRGPERDIVAFLLLVPVRMLGNWKKEENLLFEDDADRERFLDRLAERVEQYNNVLLYSFAESRLRGDTSNYQGKTPAGNRARAARGGTQTDATRTPVYHAHFYSKLTTRLFNANTTVFNKCSISRLYCRAQRKCAPAFGVKTSRQAGGNNQEGGEESRDRRARAREQSQR